MPNGIAPSHRWRALLPAQERAVRFCMAAGADARELASAYGVSKRTILRTLRRAPDRCVDVVIGDYVAPFVVPDDGPPIQRGPWVARLEP